MGTHPTAAQTPDAAQKARAKAAARATPKIAEVLLAARRIRVAELVQLVAQDAVESGMAELSPATAKKLGNPVVAHGLLVGYTPEKYGAGRWLARSTSKAIATAFEAARS